MLLDDERHVIKWLSQYGALTKTQVIRLLRDKTQETAEKILRNLKREHQISDVAGGYYLALDGLCKPDQRTILAVWVLLRFIDYVDPMAHYPAVYPSQIFFLKENTGYEIVVLYDGEQHLSKLLQPQDDEMKYIRDNRIINFDGDADQLVVDFLQKPNGDTTQEHLIDRLEKLIFQISMVANISDENFGTSSGIAMKYKLQGMSNLAKTKERKFTSGMNRRYKLIFSNPVSGMKEDDWVKLHYHFTPNIPSNVLEESQIAGNLEGIVSQETQLGVLSVVDNVQNEMKKIENEQEKAKTDPVMMQMFGGAGDGKSGVLEEPGNGSKET